MSENLTRQKNQPKDEFLLSDCILIARWRRSHVKKLTSKKLTRPKDEL